MSWILSTGLNVKSYLQSLSVTCNFRNSLMDSVNKLFISTLQQTISLIKNKKSTLSELKMVMLHRLYATTPPLNFWPTNFPTCCNIGPKPAVYFQWVRFRQFLGRTLRLELAREPIIAARTGYGAGRCGHKFKKDAVKPCATRSAV